MLRFTSGPQAGRTIPLSTGSQTLGRGSENDLVIDDRGISRVHCKFVVEGTKVYLFDLQSTNGTRIGGRQIQQATLEDGDQIQIGSGLKMRFLLLAPEEKASEEQLYQGATLDALTGVSNRRHWTEQARHQLGSCLARGKPVSLAMCDLDHFKKINDSHGHAAGDAVLIEFCRRTRGLGKDVLVGRLGGEEFGILLPGFAADRALSRLERLRKDVCDTVFPVSGSLSLPVSLSAGLVTATTPREARLEEMLKAADQALYEAKQAGRNRVRVYQKPSGDASEDLPLALRQKRRSSRCYCNEDLWLANLQEAAQLIDIGVGGLSLRALCSLELDQELEIALASQPQQVARARVRWCSQQQYGLVWTQTADELRSSWVSRVLKQLGTTAQNARERRAHPRLPVSQPFTLAAQVGTYTAHTKNVGLGGLTASSPLAPPLGLAGRLKLCGLEVQARVMWVKAPDFGLKFAPLTAAQFQQLQQLLQDWLRPT